MSQPPTPRQRPSRKLPLDLLPEAIRAELQMLPNKKQPSYTYSSFQINKLPPSPPSILWFTQLKIA